MTDEMNKVGEIQRKKKVAIIGTADTARLAPYDDPDFELWGVNNGYMVMQRYTRMFEIHNIVKLHNGTFMRRAGKDFRGQKVNDYIKALAGLNCPIYMQQHWDEIPQSVAYPLNDVALTFGSKLGWFNTPFPEGMVNHAVDAYFTNSISYMMALAILEGYEEMHVYGVDMAVDTEYNFQRPSCEFFLGWAVGRGMKVYIPPQADLLKTRFLYGFGEQAQDQFKMKLQNSKASLEKRLNDVRNSKAHMDAKENQLMGAILGIQEVEKQWS